MLNYCCDTILKKNPAALIIASGDFNDTPESHSIRSMLTEELGGTENGCIYLVTAGLGNYDGTIKYQGFWELIDHYFVSESLYSGAGKYRIAGGKAEILAPEFMLTNDEVYGGRRPLRTWQGVSYTGGASDHLPLRLQLLKNPP
jgi:endonuclease/exonuclease/phosphatase family metal-dependent hydrolase